MKIKHLINKQKLQSKFQMVQKSRANLKNLQSQNYTSLTTRREVVLNYLLHKWEIFYVLKMLSISVS